jgi:D-glycero-D-manno-heptose 1,7-bisphosphate phosphatase
VEADMSRRFVLLDRDGTINEEVGYVLSPAELHLLAGAAQAIRRLRALDLGVVVVTNQSPVGRGWMTEEELDAVHRHLRDLLRAEGTDVDGIEHCPHAPGAGCRCRKPATGMVERAAAAFAFDPADAFVVGDHAGDMAMGRAVGARTVFVLTGHGRDELAAAEPFADHVVVDLAAAVDVIRGEVLAGAQP